MAVAAIGVSAVVLTVASEVNLVASALVDSRDDMQKYKQTGKGDFLVSYQTMLIEEQQAQVITPGAGSSGFKESYGTAAAKGGRGSMTSEMTVTTNSGYVSTRNGYFDFYNGQTLTEDAVSHVVDATQLRTLYPDEEFAGHNIVGPITHTGGKTNWISFEGRTGVPNSYGLTINGGNLVYEDMDVNTQTYRGRYMVAVGPSVILGYDNYYEKHIAKGFSSVGASEMQYGTYIDVVLLDKSGGETDGCLLYVPCVVACCKAHTYPYGFYQTSIAIGDGTVANMDMGRRVTHCDCSMVEFTVGPGAFGGNLASGMKDDYELLELIVYDFGVSLRDGAE